MRSFMYIMNEKIFTETPVQWPYNRLSLPNEAAGQMDLDEVEFHLSMKPSWGPNGTLVYAAPADVKAIGRASRRGREKDGLIIVRKGAVVSEKRDIRFAHFSNEVCPYRPDE